MPNNYLSPVGKVHRDGLRTLRIVAVFLATSLYLYPFIRVLHRVGDEGTIVYGAELAARGFLPYRDFFEVMGPLSFYWLALFFKIFGTHLIVARGLLLVTGAISAVLLYWMTRRVCRGSYDVIPALFYTLISIPMWSASNHHWDSNLFVLLAFLVYLLWQDSKRLPYLFIAGLCAGLVSCFMQQKGLLMIVAFFVFELWQGLRHRQGKLRVPFRLAVVLSGYIGVGASVLLFFYIQGGLRELVYAGLLWPLSNYHNANIVPYAYGLWEFNWPYLLQVFHAFFPMGISRVLSLLFLLPFLLIAILPFVMVLLGGLALVNRTKQEQTLTSLIPAYSLVGTALWVSEIHRMDIMHLTYGAPLLLIVVFFLWKVVAGSRPVLWRSTLALLTVVLVMIGMLNLVVVSTAKTALTTRRGNIYAFNEDRVLRFLVEHTASGEEVFVYPYYPMYYFLGDVRNPTRYSWLMYRLNTYAQFAEVIESLERKKVRYVLWDTIVEGDNIRKWFPAYVQPAKEALRLERYLERYYRVIGVENGFRILERSTVTRSAAGCSKNGDGEPKLPLF